jgi:hypothetical protein
VAGRAGATSALTVTPGANRGGSASVCRDYGYFQQTHGTIFHGKRVSSDMLVWAVSTLAEDFLPFVNPNLSNFYPISTTGSRRFRVAS